MIRCLVILLANPPCACAGGGEKVNLKFLATLPMPGAKQTPGDWQWKQEDAERVTALLGKRGELQRHFAGPVAPKSLKDPVPREKSPPPAVARGHGGMTYVNWDLGLDKLIDLSIDVTFHTSPRPPASVYLQLYDFKIGVTGQYFGFQYVWDKGKPLRTQFIWSRWETRDKSDAWVAPGGWIESAGYEGDFVGIRYPVPVEAGLSYTVHLAMRETDARGTWYELRLFHHSKREWLKVGRLRFPADKDGLPFIKNGGGSWCEVFGGTKSSTDIAPFRLSYGGVYTCGRTVAAREVRINYGDTAPNSDVSIEPEGRRVHVLFGGSTVRRTAKGTYPLPAEKEPLKK